MPIGLCDARGKDCGKRKSCGTCSTWRLLQEFEKSGFSEVGAKNIEVSRIIIHYFSFCKKSLKKIE